MKPEPNTIMQFDNESGKFIRVNRYDIGEVDADVRRVRANSIASGDRWVCPHDDCDNVIRDIISCPMGPPSPGCLGLLLAFFLASLICAAYLFKLVFLN